MGSHSSLAAGPPRSSGDRGLMGGVCEYVDTGQTMRADSGLEKVVMGQSGGQ